MADRVAATAAHCLAGLDPADAHLLLGYRSMSWSEHLRPVLALVPDAARDVVLVCLDRTATAAPLALAFRPPAAGDAVEVEGYGKPAVHRRQRRSCGVVARTGPSEFMVDCGLSPGWSGSPVLILDEGEQRVAGIVSRSARSYAIVVELRRADVEAALAAC